MMVKKMTKTIPMVSFVPLTSSYTVMHPRTSKESSRSQLAMCRNQEVKYFRIE